MTKPEMDQYVLGLEDVGRGDAAVVGGKGANLGELSRIPGIRVPAGFCVTTHSYRRAWTETHLGGRFDRLAALEPGDTEGIRAVSAEIREAFERLVLPDDLTAAITFHIERIGDNRAFAVRSSATTEDGPTASFAGQHDTYLNVIGPQAVLRSIKQCWSSLFTESALSYGLKQSVDHRHAEMGVVVQQMVSPEAAGVAFTVDPVTSNRRVVSVEAAFGLGHSVVSGRVNADVYKVRDGEVVEKVVANKEIVVAPSVAGGIREEPLDVPRQRLPVLADGQVIQLAAWCRHIEAHFGYPQDIEWCLVADGFEFVQSRPITALFPVPERDDGENHVYVSVGHGQMMTDALRPLGISMWRLTARPPMHVAGGRLFVDVTQGLASPESRSALLAVFGRGDPLIRDALQTVVDRADFLPALPDDIRTDPQPADPSPADPPPQIEADPAIVHELMGRTQKSIAGLKRNIRAKSGAELLDLISEDIAEMRRILFDPVSHRALMAGIEATWWLNDRLEEWLGETNAADVLTRSAPNNVTSQMGLDLLDVADVIRPFPEVVDFLHRVDDDDFLDDGSLTKLEGGPAAQHAIRSYLDTYGMRCIGEIDITRPRWSERPTALLPVILGNIQTFELGESRRRFEQGEREAAEKEAELMERLRALPGGEDKARETKQMIDRVRTFIGYREYPKYGMIHRYFIYKRALVGEAERLQRTGVLREPDDIFFVTFDELREIVRTVRVDDELIASRKRAFRSYGALTPPRVLTSDGEALSGSYGRRDIPPGSLLGLAVSSGVVEGRARVVLDMADAHLETGDILVTTHTDPSWSPLFPSAMGLVTEVGGLMTHGTVIAREYGLVAVVGVEHATRLIQDGQRIRVNGTDGFIELLDDTESGPPVI